MSQFTYGSDGLRRASNVNGTIRKYMLDNGMMIRETDANGASQATYLAGRRGPDAATALAVASAVRGRPWPPVCVRGEVRLPPDTDPHGPARTHTDPPERPKQR